MSSVLLSSSSTFPSWALNCVTVRSHSGLGFAEKARFDTMTYILGDDTRVLGRGVFRGHVISMVSKSFLVSLIRASATRNVLDPVNVVVLSPHMTIGESLSPLPSLVPQRRTFTPPGQSHPHVTVLLRPQAYSLRNIWPDALWYIDMIRPVLWCALRTKCWVIGHWTFDGGCCTAVRPSSTTTGRCNALDSCPCSRPISRG